MKQDHNVHIIHPIQCNDIGIEPAHKVTGLHYDF